MTFALDGIRRVFASLDQRNYRLFFIGQLVSLSGTWMQQVAQDWLVLDLTGRALPVGITAALQFGPVLLLASWGGLVADRYDKRRILLLTQGTACVLAAVLGVLVLTGQVRLWTVYLLAGLLGVVTSFDMPARQAFVSEMVGRERLANAVALNSALVNAGRLIGPAVAGVTIVAFGVGPAFLVNASSYLAVVTALLLMDSRLLRRSERAEREGGQLREGFRYAWNHPLLRSTLMMVAVIATVGFNTRVILPLLARFEFGSGPNGYGLMASVMAVGSVVGALAAAARARPTRELQILAAVLLGIGSLGGAVAPTLGTELIALPILGGGLILFMSTSLAILQVTSEPRLRGRVIALHATLFLGSTPFGSLLAAWQAEALGPRAALAFGGVVCLLVAGVAALFNRRARERARGQDPVAEAEPPVARPDVAA